MVKTAVSADGSGFVYLLTNASMPGFVKIGMTTRNPAVRAREISSATGVPTAFVLEGYVPTPDAARTERAVHAVIDNRRVSQGREFFRIDVDDAMRVVRHVAEKERLAFVNARKAVSPFRFLNLLAVIPYLNAVFYLAGLDMHVLWKVGAANAAAAVFVPSRLWNWLFSAMARFPLIAHGGILASLYVTARLFRPEVLDWLRVSVLSLAG